MLLPFISGGIWWCSFTGSDLDFFCLLTNNYFQQKRTQKLLSDSTFWRKEQSNKKTSAKRTLSFWLETYFTTEDSRCGYYMGNDSVRLSKEGVWTLKRLIVKWLIFLYISMFRLPVDNFFPQSNTLVLCNSPVSFRKDSKGQAAKS